MSPAELAARYRGYAANCVVIAQTFEETTEKLLLLDMAQAWLALADQAEKNAPLFAICETPEPPQQAAQQQQQVQPDPHNPENG